MGWHRAAFAGQFLCHWSQTLLACSEHWQSRDKTSPPGSLVWCLARMVTGVQSCGPSGHAIRLSPSLLSRH